MEDYKDWKKFTLKSLSFYAPKTLQAIKTKCIDSECFRFQDPTFRLDIDFSFDAFRPSFEKKYPSYEEKSIWNDETNGISAWMWCFEDASRSRYHAGVLFSFRHKKHYLVNINLLSEGTNIREISEKIFRSVEFSNRVKLGRDASKE